MKFRSLAAATLSTVLLGTGLAAALPNAAHAAPGKTTVTQVDETNTVPARDACGFPLSVGIKVTVTSYDNGRQHVEIYSNGTATITNPRNNKVFKRSGDGAFVDYYNRSRTQTDSIGTGVQLFWGDIDLPGSQKGREVRKRMIYTDAKTHFEIHDAKRADGGWLKLRSIDGRYVDVCAVLR